MELVQDKISGEFFIKADGFMATNSDDYFNHTDEIGSWVQHGLPLTDGKVVKANVKRIVELNGGPNLDADLLALPNDDLIKMAGKELLFELIQSTLVPTYMTLEEYNDARLYRQKVSAEARASRWEAMLKELTHPDVLTNGGKLYFLSEELKKYKDDYVISDNKIFQAFIDAFDHPLAPLSGSRPIAFGNANNDIALDNLSLWDDVNLGGPDADYKNLVSGIIHGCIVNAEHYITQ